MTIKEALDTIGLPVEKLNYSGVAETYITFFEYQEISESSSDDEIEVLGHYVQVDLWTKTDFTIYKKQIKSAMKLADFVFTNGQELFEEDTKVYHYATRFVASEDYDEN